MKDWIKLETTLLQDERIVRLQQETGTKGVGIYVILRLLVDGTNGCPLKTLQNYASAYARINTINQVLQEYGLFEQRHKTGSIFTVPYGRKPICRPLDTLIDATADVPAHTPAQAPASAPAPVPINNEEENRKENPVKEAVGEGADLPPEELSDKEKEFYVRMQQHYPNICRMKYPLTYAEQLRLLKDFSMEEVLAVLNDMENCPKLQTKYLSANLTCRGWISARNKKH